MKKLYLSGPMTGIPNKNFPEFIRATKALRKAGYIVTSPHELETKDIQCTWENCMRRDIKAEMTCEAIATLKGWKKSKGANVEVYIGEALKYPVHTVDYYLKRRK
jgi:Domain of unknown function (DUF4406)